LRPKQLAAGTPKSSPRPVRLLEAAVVVEERHAGGGVGEKRWSAGGIGAAPLPLVLPRQVAQHRARAQPLLVWTAVWLMAARHQEALAAAEGHLAALGVVAGAMKGACFGLPRRNLRWRGNP